MVESRHFFLGANSAQGFYSLYQQLGRPQKTRDLMVLKGGPGVGKSSFMPRIAKRMEQEGETVEYIHCSGDPDSLDGVLIPERKLAIVDGTAPHVVEPAYPGAVERYVDLGQFYRVEELKARREALIEAADAYRESYAQAYRCFRAAGLLRQELQSELRPGLDQATLLRRGERIARREFSGGKQRVPGEVTLRFLGGRTCRGHILRWDTVHTLCDRLYMLEDSWQLGGGLLEQLQQQAVKAGYEVIACPNPDRPEQLSHLLLPELRLGFVTGEESSTKPFRRIRIDALLDRQWLRQNRGRLRLYRHMAEELCQEGEGHLAQAKQEHDVLESLYNPCVNFDGVYALAEQEYRRWKTWIDG